MTRLALRWFPCLCLASLAFPQTLPTESLDRHLPSWVQFSGEERLRLEGYSGLGYQPGDDTYLLHRFRFNLSLTPVPWLKIFAQTQDSRAFWKSAKPYAPPFQDTWDLRQAYAEAGDPDKSPAAVRVGRQELAFGEERLLGPANWINTPRVFDAARATFRYRRFRLDAFASSVVVLRDGRVGSADAGSNLYGLYGSIKDVIPGAALEPFVLWRLQPRVKPELGAVGNLDMKVPGIRLDGKARAFDYGTEIALERGSLAADQVAAWAGHWVAGYSLTAGMQSIRLYQEYNFASGDGSAHDGRRNTFDELYPSGHDKLGLSDQVGWRNIRHVRSGAEWKPRQKLMLSIRYNSYWLANAHDALYNSAGTAYVQKADGSAGRWVGQEADALGVYQWTRFAQAGAGFSHIFPGTFLRLATPGRSYNQPYLFLTTQF
jgi:hypothetical protein